ncbi:hypothetical protein OHS70_37535 [Streptomyces sp. NBC_00390]|uniref:hypothetical protein n=1 Tax=Streptomyces sp. NBC_00390 TaxID=2975736 RepID=UPI002E21BEDE
MSVCTRKSIWLLAGASCAAALLAGPMGVAGAAAAPRTTQDVTESSSAAPHDPCTGYHYDENHNRVWDPPGCTPP